MSRYTTGELAKLCGVSVRTVQYYDTRGILTPSELTEGGRRLYSQEDVKRLKLICFLREMEIPINQIGELLSDPEPRNVIALLLEQQEEVLQKEIIEKQKKLNCVEEIKKELRNVKEFSVEMIGDIAFYMENKKKLRQLYIILVLTGLPMGIWQWGSILLWIFKGIWWPFALYVPIGIVYAICISKFYFNRVAYICPECHEVFRPRFKEAFLARHTPTLRKLTCTHCGYHGFCVETYGGKEEE